MNGATDEIRWRLVQVAATRLHNIHFFSELSTDDRAVVSLVSAGTRSLIDCRHEALLKLQRHTLLAVSYRFRVSLLLLVQMTILYGQIGALIVVLSDVLVEIKFGAHFVSTRSYRNKTKSCHNHLNEL